jgi:hypothetical protein
MKTNDYFRRTAIIVIVIIALLGISIEFIRSEFIFKFTKNINASVASSSLEENALDQHAFDQINKERFLILFDPKEVTSPKLAKNLEDTINYMKKSPSVMEIDSFHGDTTGYETIVIAFQDLSRISNLDGLMEYVNNGGRVLFAESPGINDALYKIYRELGIKSVGTYSDEKGLKLTSNILIKGKGTEFKGSFLLNSILTVALNENSKIYATTEKNTPLIWSANYGKGRFMVFNGSILQEKASRGIITGTIGLLYDDFIYPIINTKMTFIDDFPAPFGNGTEENIYKEYGRNNQRFYKDIWWPAMIKMAKNRELKYTGGIIENYNNNIKAPFNDQFGEEKDNLIIYGRELLKLGGEIAIHGYNHQSLVTEHSASTISSLSLGYKLWKTQEDMELSLTEVSSYFGNVYPNYKLLTYVPPSNVLSMEGRQALKNVLPDLKIISSVYNEDPSNKAYVQEYRRHPDGLLELPRVSSGYSYSDEDKWSIFNAISSIGVYSHFIHPDDVLDPYRAQHKTWEDLYLEFDGMMADIHEKYSWLRPMTASEGGSALENYLDSQIVFKKDKNKIDGYINHFQGDLNYILRTKSKVGKLENCTVTAIDDGTYLVHAKKAHFAIELGDQL